MTMLQRRLLIGFGIIVLATVLLRTAWVAEDAYITFRTVDNLVNGHGPKWNVTERVQSYTHPLWMFLMSAVYFFTREAYYTSLALNLVLSLVAVTLFAFKIAKTATAALLGLLALTLSKAFIDYSTSGLENPLTHMLLCGFLFVGIVLQVNTRRLFALSLVAALGAVNRLDTLCLFLPLLAYHVIKLRALNAVGVVALGFVPLVLWELFSLFYYGFPVPNTAYAKLNTGIARIELMQQGIHYLGNSLRRDALSLSLIVTAITMPLVTGNRRHFMMAAGMALYLTYIVWVGGDFMSGRFLTAPLFCAVVVLSRCRWDTPKTWAPVALGVVLVSLITPPLTLLSGADYGTNRDGLEDEHNITDERGYYFQETGLLRAAGHGVDNFSESIRGRKVRAQGRSVMMAGNVGFFGFYAGPDVHIVDGFALADPLLARLPVRSVRWRIGHFIRTIPDGYLQTLARRKNMIKDARLAMYYDRLGFIIRGDLFSVKRLGEVVDMNLGRYDARLEPFFKAREHQVEGFKALEHKDTSTALIHLQQSVALDSTRAAAWYGLYLAHRESGDLARAQATIEKTIALEPEKYGKELINLAGYYMKAEQTDSAILLFKKYLRLEPQSLDAHLGLAAAYEQTGFTEKAIKEYRRVLSLEPNRSDIRKQLSRLMR